MWTLRHTLAILFTALYAKGDRLLVAHNHEILLMDVEGRVNRTVVVADSPVVALDIHLEWHQIFWATESTIYRTTLYDPHASTQLALVGRLGSLSVDWVHHHVYWTDLYHRRVEAVHMDGTRRRVVHRVGNGSIGAMVMDPLLGKLLWLERHNNQTHIIKCNLDGSETRTLYQSEFIPEDSPLAIDTPSSHVYFYKVANGSGSELWKANYQTPDEVFRLYEREGRPPKSMCLAKDGLYFSTNDGTYSSKWVERRYTLVYGNRTDYIFYMEPYFLLVYPQLTNSSQMRVVSEAVQPSWPDVCASHQCEHDCVVISHHEDDYQLNTSCVCRYGYSLRADGRSCKEHGYLLYSSGTTFGRISTNGEDNALLYNDSGANIQAFDVDIDSEYVYWSDLFAQTIYRAPVEKLSRKEVVVANVTAFGLVVDWLHHNVYWTDQSRILVTAAPAASEGEGGPLVILDSLDAPANMAVDPFDKYIFWVECGALLSIKRAGLGGDDVTEVVSSDVTCGMSLTADHESRSLFILDWAGAVSLCGYDGSGLTRLNSDVLRGLAVLDHQPLWTLIDFQADPNPLNILAHDLQPSMVRVVKGSQQPGGESPCGECRGVCLEANTTACGQSDEECDTFVHTASCIHNTSGKARGPSPNDYLTVLQVTPYSVTLKCGGPLMKHNKMRPWVRLDEVDSLVQRGPAVRRNHFKIEQQSAPFVVSGLNPASSYRLTVQHGVTRASRSLTVHTPPPPLAVRRKAIITVPGLPGVIPWNPQDVHYDSSNPWEHLVKRKYFLLLLSNDTLTQADPPLVSQEILTQMQHVMKKPFMVLKAYKSEDDFDDDPTMNLANIPWGETYQVAMVQATDYRGSYNLDFVTSKDFALPDPYWRPFVDRVLKHEEVVDSIERL